MKKLLIFGSENCLGWDEVQELIEKLEEDSDFSVPIQVIDPFENEQLFREYGLVVCPSFLYDEELIATGTPESSVVKEKVREMSR